jgi:hypothetical protein
MEGMIVVVEEVKEQGQKVNLPNYICNRARILVLSDLGSIWPDS